MSVSPYADALPQRIADLVNAELQPASGERTQVMMANLITTMITREVLDMIDGLLIEIGEAIEAQRKDTGHSGLTLALRIVERRRLALNEASDKVRVWI